MNELQSQVIDQPAPSAQPETSPHQPPSPEPAVISQAEEVATNVQQTESSPNTENNEDTRKTREREVGAINSRILNGIVDNNKSFCKKFFGEDKPIGEEEMRRLAEQNPDAYAVLTVEIINRPIPAEGNFKFNPPIDLIAGGSPLIGKTRIQTSDENYTTYDASITKVTSVTNEGGKITFSCEGEAGGIRRTNMKFTQAELLNAQLVSRNEVFQRNLDQQIAAETDPQKKELLQRKKELLTVGGDILEGRTDVLDSPDLDTKIETVANAEAMNTRPRWEGFFKRIDVSLISEIKGKISEQEAERLRAEAINKLGDRVLTDPNNIVEAFNELGFTEEFFTQQATTMEKTIEQHRQQLAHAEKNGLLDGEGREQAAQKLAFEEDQLEALRALSGAFQPDGIFVQTWRNMDNGVTPPEDAAAMLKSLNAGEPMELLENTLKTYVHEQFGMDQQALADRIEERKKAYVRLYKKNPTGNILLGLLMAALLEAVQGTTDAMGVPLR